MKTAISCPHCGGTVEKYRNPLLTVDVIIEVGLKSEGSVSSSEFNDPSEIVVGDTVEVLLESVESDSGLVQLSKRKADRIRGWERDSW